MAPIDGAWREIPRTELCEGAVLRNLLHAELSTLNQMLPHDRQFGFGIGELPKDVICFEASLQLPESPTLQQHQGNVGELGGRCVDRAVSLIRLAQAGPIGARLVIRPLSEQIPSAYTLVQTSYIPAVHREHYPGRYVMSAATLETIKKLFAAHWSRDLTETPGLRWFNKAYVEINDDDRLAHLVFGLEQLLLRGETERSYFSFKMALRGAWLLSPPDESRSADFR